jgi:hypothetical protein
MIVPIVIAALVAGLSLYDYFTARRWQQITSSVRNEMVFEHRNRAYGAYVLRRDYEKRLPKKIQNLWGLQRDCFWCIAKCVSKYALRCYTMSHTATPHSIT